MSSIETISLARRSLKQSLERSRALGSALQKAGPRFDEIHHRLPSIEAALRPIRAEKDALSDVAGHIDRAVGPAAAVLKVFDAVHGLEPSLLSDPRSDLAGYLSVLHRLEEALAFLAANSGLAVQWLDDIVEYLEENSVADHRYLSDLKNSLKTLRELGHNSLDGGLLDAALEKLEVELRRLLDENSVPLPMPSSAADDQQQPCIAPSPLPRPVLQKIQLIIDRLTANNRLERCISIYVDVRSSNLKASLRELNLDYLEISISEFDNAQSIEGYIAKWGKHLEFSVKHLFEAEFELCNDVFEKLGNEVSMECFSKVANESGILSFLQFGMTVTESKKDPIKLLKLLDIFASLNNLRLDFNRLFGGKACIDVQNMTRDLIKAVIEGACEIFWELLVQVELQRQMPPPPNGGVPRLVSFITDYCNRLVGDDYRPILTQVLVIHRSWKQEKFQERLLMNAVLNIIKAVEMNLESWGKAYEDVTLSHFFLMNNHWHLFRSLKGTKLGDLLGNTWLKEHEQYKDYFSAIYLRDSWAKLPPLLSREGLIMFSGGRATARDLVKKRLKAFNEAFDEMYKKQSKWVMPDKELREKTCQSVVQTIVPVYRSYMQNYGPLVDQDVNASKYTKYTVQSLETMLGSLFHQKLVKYGSAKTEHSNGKLNSPVTNQFHSSPTGK